MPLTIKVTAKGNMSGIDNRFLKDVLKNQNVKKGEVIPKEIQDLFTSSLVDMLIKEALSSSAVICRKRIIKIAAILFDRVCSRTPIDEDYKFIITKNDKSYEFTHHADKNFCRFDWHIKIGTRTFTSYELWRSKNSLFEKYNDSSDIDYIYEYFYANAGNAKIEDLANIELYNNNDHFDVLEFGRYEVSSSPVKNGRKYEHGVKNHHSVQAPNGMMRLTLAELDRIADSSASRSLERRYRSQRTSKVLNTKQMTSLANALKKGNHRFSLSDIAGILGSEAGKE